MGVSKTATFTGNGSWTCPEGVSAVWLMMVGGGSGAPGSGDSFNDHGATGGAGSAELCVGRMVPVTPGNIYSVVVGAKGTGTTHGVAPIAAGDSSFNGYVALKAGPWAPSTLGSSNSGSGGGVGGSVGFIAGAGFDVKGRLESRHYVGGAGGKGGTPTYGGEAGVSGGVQASPGTPGTPGSGVGGVTPTGGGAGAGSLWGGTDGGDGGGTNLATLQAPANLSHYGAGAGGTGEASTNPFITGGDGAGGYVVLMWVGSE